MNLNFLLGLAGIVLGAKTLTTGAQRLAGALSEGSPSGRRAVIKGVPTTFVPRAVTMREAPIVSRGARMGTVAGPMRRTLREVKSLNQRLATIIASAEDGKTNPMVVAWTRRVTSAKGRDGNWLAAEKDTAKEIELIRNAVRRDIRYTSDPVGVDLYSSAQKTLEMRAGDCDEMNAFTLAALKSIGINADFKVIRTKGSSTPDHIYLMASDTKNGAAGKMIPVDTTVDKPYGWEAPPSMVAEAWIYKTE